MPNRVNPSNNRKKRTESVAKPVVGWREWVALPQLDIGSIKAKIDTGARTSSVHAFNIKPFRKDGQDWVSFDVHPLQRNDEVQKTCSAPAVDYRWVTNSGGDREKRFVVVTMLRMGPNSWPIEMTLTDRDQMGFRMLLGRTAMEGRLVVDPALSYRLGNTKRKKRIGKSKPVQVAVSIGAEEE